MTRFIHTKGYNALVNIALACICIVCYLLLMILFLSPNSFHLSSLVVVQNSKIKPAVVVGLLSTVFSGASSALVTRAVEHHLWLKLAPRKVENHLTVAETHRLAQWSVSPGGRIAYIVTGHSWQLKIGGMLLFGLGVVNPVLLSGISQTDRSSTSTSFAPSTGGNFAGFLDRSNSAYNGGNFRDNLMSVAALAQMSNVTAPASSLCTTDGCSATASAASIQAVCNSYELDNTDKVGTQSSSAVTNILCSRINPQLCLTLSKNNPATYANFTTALPPSCEDSLNPCVGVWSTIFGVWVNVLDPSQDTKLPINVVDCTLSYGNVTISQNGSSTPQLDRSSFVQSTHLLAEYGSAPMFWRRIYNDWPTIQSPYTFAGAAGGVSSNSLYEATLGLFLINYAAGDSAQTVASRIEANFDMGTLFAFARAPGAASVTLRTDTRAPVWVYNKKVLAILVVPLLATLLSLWGRCAVGDDETVIGYNPVGIAMRGPVEGLAVNYALGEKGNADEIGRLRVWGKEENTYVAVQEVMPDTKGRVRFAVAPP